MLTSSLLLSAVTYTMISIPSIGFREPVFHCPMGNRNSIQGCVDRNRAVLHPSVNAILAHDNVVFPDKLLTKVKAGDKFRFGRSRYKVYDVRIVQAEEVWVLDGIPDDEIRIQTCYSDDPNEYPAKRRVIVFAKKI